MVVRRLGGGHRRLRNDYFFRREHGFEERGFVVGFNWMLFGIWGWNGMGREMVGGIHCLLGS